MKHGASNDAEEQAFCATAGSSDSESSEDAHQVLNVYDGGGELQANRSFEEVKRSANSTKGATEEDSEGLANGGEAATGSWCSFRCFCCATCLSFVALLLCTVGYVFYLRYFVVGREVERILVEKSELWFGTKCSAGDVSLALLSGRVSVQDYKIGNPSGFLGDFIDLRSLVFDLKIASVLAPRPALIQEITLEHLNLNIIKNVNGVLNTQAIYKVFMATPWLFKGVTVRADKLVVRRLQASLQVEPLTEMSGPITLTLSDLVMHDVGKVANGVTVEEFFNIWIHTLLWEIQRQAPDAWTKILFSGLDTYWGLSNTTMDVGSVESHLAKEFVKVHSDEGVFASLLRPMSSMMKSFE